MRRLFSRTFSLFTMLGLLLMFGSSTALAQYKLVKLVSNQAGKAAHQDTLLVNAWGITYGPTGPFWISDAGNGWSTTYNGSGVAQSVKITIPSAGTGPGSPTGIVYNGSQEFQIDGWASVFLFDTLDGTISGWSPFSPKAALIAVNNSASGAVYTGLAITNKPSGNFLYAADTVNNKVDVYDGTFSLVTSFTDPALPTGFTPLGIQDISGQVYVAFGDLAGGSGGFIDVFSEAGVFVKHLIHGKPLNQPWGIAMAPRNFGTLSNTLLIANNTNSGTINGFDPTSGKLVGTVTDASNKPIKIDQLWGIVFGGGSALNGKTKQLFFTAGPNDNLNGIFGAIEAQ